ncbi:VWFA domain-containing protein [Balamuthia mandrillaris]
MDSFTYSSSAMKKASDSGRMIDPAMLSTEETSVQSTSDCPSLAGEALDCFLGDSGFRSSKGGSPAASSSRTSSSASRSRMHAKENSKEASSKSRSESRSVEDLAALMALSKELGSSSTVEKSSAKSDSKSRASSPSSKEKRHHIAAAIERRKEEIRQTIKFIQLSSRVEICFLVDCTGSMGSWIDAVKDSIQQMAFDLQSEHPQNSFFWSFVRYTDYDQPASTRTSYLPFTNQLSTFKSFVGGIVANGGGDGPEDVMGGLQVMLDLPWTQQATKVLIHIADAPCHGKQYHSLADDYPGGDPAGIDHDVIMMKVSGLGIRYFFGFIHACHTDKMISIFSDSLARYQGARIEQFNAREPAHIALEVVSSVSKSVTIEKSASKMPSSTDAESSFREYTISRAEPSWSNADSFEARVTQICFKLPELNDILPGEKGGVCNFSLSERRTTQTIRLCKNPFAEGGSRLAYRAFIPAHKKEVVVKMSKKLGARSNCKRKYLLDMEAQTVAALFALEFNKVKPPSAPTLKYIVAKVIHFQNTSRPIYASLEVFLKGDVDFEKFNNNFDWVSGAPYAEPLQAFSHWTWEASNHSMMATDLQGYIGDGGKKVTLTDPAIHSTNILKFGNTNLGLKGINGFFQKHVCGKTCVAMGLDRLKWDA